MRVFVTGGTGLLGNNLVRALKRTGHQVVALARSKQKAQRLLSEVEVSWVTGDIRDTERLAPYLEGCDAVVHTAAYFREYYQPGDHARALREINVEATLRLMRAADRAQVKRFVHTSSSGTIGNKEDGSPGDETTPPARIAYKNRYFASKLQGDQEIREFVPEHGMSIIEILPGWMWGPGDAGPTSAGQLVLDFLARRVPAIPQGGTCVVDARDVAEAILRSLERGQHGDRFVVGGRYLSVAEVLSELEQLSGIPGPRTRLPYPLVLTFATLAEAYGRLSGRPVPVTRVGVQTLRAELRVSSAKAQKELGITFRPFPNTLRDVVAWYQEQQGISAAAS